MRAHERRVGSTDPVRGRPVPRVIGEPFLRSRPQRRAAWRASHDCVGLIVSRRRAQWQELLIRTYWVSWLCGHAGSWFLPYFLQALGVRTAESGVRGLPTKDVKNCERGKSRGGRPRAPPPTEYHLDLPALWKEPSHLMLASLSTFATFIF